MLTHSFPFMVIPHLTVWSWSTGASPTLLICRQKRKKVCSVVNIFLLIQYSGKLLGWIMGKEEKSGGFFPPDCPLGKNKNRWDLCCRTVWLCKETGKSQVTNGVNLGNFSFKAAKQHWITFHWQINCWLCLCAQSGQFKSELARTLNVRMS